MTRAFWTTAKIAFLFSIVLLSAACGPMVYTNVPLKPGLNTPLPEIRYPFRVAMLADKDLMEYVATGKDSIGIPLQYKVKTLPNYYMKVLVDHFDSAEAVYEAAQLSKDRYDAVATMTAARWHFNVPVQTYLSATLDMEMTFVIKTMDGNSLFSTTIVKKHKMPWGQVQNWGVKGFAKISSPVLEEVFAQLAGELETSNGLRAFKP